jgi:hypothetical protein
MMTMAIQRASSTMIRPVRYSGRSGSMSQASANMSAGPTSQLSTSDSNYAAKTPTACSASPRTWICSRAPSATGSHRTPAHRRSDSPWSWHWITPNGWPSTAPRRLVPRSSPSTISTSWRSAAVLPVTGRHPAAHTR